MPKDNSSVQLMSNSFYLMADWITVTVLSLIFWLIVGKTMSTSGYGILATTINMSLLIAVFGLVGLPIAATNLISKFQKKKQPRKVSGVIKFSLKFGLAISVAASSILIVFANQISYVINIPIETVWMASVFVFGWTFWLLTNSFLQGLQNMRLIFKSDLVGHIFKVIVPGVLVFIGFSYMGFLIAFLGSLFVTTLMRYSIFRPGRSSKIKGKKIILTLALPMLITSVMWLVFVNLPNVILNSLTSPEITGIFALTLTLVTPIVFIPMTLSVALFPIISGLSVSKDPKEKQGSLISLVIKYSMLITVPLITLLLIFSNEIILLFSQAEYLPASGLLPIVAPAALLLGMGQILVSSIFAVGKPKKTRNITILTTVIFLAVSIPATMIFYSKGMALSYLASMIILVVSSYLCLRKLVRLKISWFGILKVVSASLIFAAVSMVIGSISDSMIMKVVAASLGIIVYFTVLLPMRYYSENEVVMLSHLSMKYPALKGKVRRIINVIEMFSK